MSSWRRRPLNDPSRRFLRPSALRAAGTRAVGVPAGAGRPAPQTVLLDDKLVVAEEANISIFDRGLLYGESLFETIKVVDEAPCLWEGHRDRLAAGCRQLGFPIDEVALEAGLRRLLAAVPITHGLVRVQVTGGVQPGGGRGLTAPREGRHPRVIAVPYESAPYPSDLYSTGAAVVTAREFRRPLPSLKSGSYLASVAAKMRAEETVAFEALLVEGDPPELLEGSFTNVLLWDGHALVTPPPGRVLPGVTLAEVRAVAADLGWEVREEPVFLSQVLGNGLLLTSSLLGVCHCASVDGRALVPLRSLATRLQDGLRLREEASIARWQAAEGGPRERR